MVIAAIKFQSCGYSKFRPPRVFTRSTRELEHKQHRTNIKYMRAGAVSFFPRGNDNNSLGLLLIYSYCARLPPPSVQANFKIEDTLMRVFELHPSVCRVLLPRT